MNSTDLFAEITVIENLNDYMSQISIWGRNIYKVNFSFSFQVTVYECLEGGVIAVLQSYIDEDVSKDGHHSVIYEMHQSLFIGILSNGTGFIVLSLKPFANVIFVRFVDQKDESFYTVSWACNVDGTPFLVAGGFNGTIRVIDCGSEKIDKVSC